ncbi:MAG: TRAP transporter substrate-binding protein DctP, partial [Bacillota bacterium]
MTRFRQMRVICICMSFALLLLVIMTGCGKQTASQPSSPSAPATSPKDASQVIELTFNDHDPAVSTIAKAWMDWAKWVEEKSGGRIKINYVPGGALLKGNEVFRGVQSGVAHGGHYVVNRDDGFLLNLVVALPFMNMPAQKEAAEIYKQLLSKFPEMQAEWKGIKILGVIMMPPTQIHTTNKVVKTPQDIKGIRLHAAESIVSEAMSAAGASMVEMDIADMAMSLDRKLIQGVVNHFPVLGVFNALEKLPYHTVVGDGGINMTPMFAIMNA